MSDNITSDLHAALVAAEKRAEKAERERDEALTEAQSSVAKHGAAYMELLERLHAALSGRDELMARLQSAEKARDDARKDAVEAAGELRVSVPEPGTDMARLLVANRLLKRRAERALDELDVAQDNLVKHNQAFMDVQDRCNAASNERDALKADLDALRKHVAVLGGTGKGAALTEKERAVLIYEGASRLWQRTTWGGSDEDVSARVAAFAAAMLRAAEAEALRNATGGDK